jgi:hypothetical protein
MNRVAATLGLLTSLFVSTQSFAATDSKECFALSLNVESHVTGPTLLSQPALIDMGSTLCIQSSTAKVISDNGNTGVDQVKQIAGIRQTAGTYTVTIQDSSGKIAATYVFSYREGYSDAGGENFNFTDDLAAFGTADENQPGTQLGSVTPGYFSLRLWTQTHGGQPSTGYITLGKQEHESPDSIFFIRGVTK